MPCQNVQGFSTNDVGTAADCFLLSYFRATRTYIMSSSRRFNPIFQCSQKMTRVEIFFYFFLFLY